MPARHLLMVVYSNDADSYGVCAVPATAIGAFGCVLDHAGAVLNEFLPDTPGEEPVHIEKRLSHLLPFWAFNANTQSNDKHPRRPVSLSLILTDPATLEISLPGTAALWKSAHTGRIPLQEALEQVDALKNRAPLTTNTPGQLDARVIWAPGISDDADVLNDNLVGGRVLGLVRGDAKTVDSVCARIAWQQMIGRFYSGPPSRDSAPKPHPMNTYDQECILAGRLILTYSEMCNKTAALPLPDKVPEDGLLTL